MDRGSERKYPVNADDYQLQEEIGDGVSATVFRALCVPLNELVAIKVLDLEKCNNDLDGIRREVQTMTLIDHPNVLRARCSFTSGHSLWVVMPFMAGGSCLHIMKSSYPDGFEEAVIATLLKEVLKALVYLHSHGHIHRDVKAGNILFDSDGSVKLGDFGVAACMYDAGDRQRARNTFVGTPCWMAPEVMQNVQGYDFKADIWSFGITALELAHGHAPFSKYPPMKVLLMTLQNAPPGLDYERDKRFSKSFKELVAACLVKDPKKRPSAEKLLKHHFFKQARSADYLARLIIDGLSPLGDRYRMLKAKEAELLNKSRYEDKEQLSQQEYMKGISAWNFNLEDLKNQAALIPDDDTSNADNRSLTELERDGQSDGGSWVEGASPRRLDNFEDEPRPEDEVDDNQDLENSLAAFPMKPLQALKGCFDICEDDIPAVSPTWNDAAQSEAEQSSKIKSPKRAEDQEVGKDYNDGSRMNSSISQSVTHGSKKFFSGSLVPENIISSKKPVGDGLREHLQPRYPADRNYSGPLQSRQRKDSNHSLSGDDTSEGAIVQRKGRFKVTSADISPKGLIGLNSGASTSSSTPNLSAASVLPSLHCILQQNTIQKDEINKLIKYVEQSSANLVESADGGANDSSQNSQMPSSSVREKELQAQVFQLQQSIGSLVEELQRQKMKNVQLEKKLNVVAKKDDKI